MKRILALILAVFMVTGSWCVAHGQLWDEAAGNMEQTAHHTTQEIKELYDRDGTLTDLNVEILYRMYNLERAAREVKLMAKVNWHTIRNGGVDVYADTDVLIGEQWKSYLAGKTSKDEFLTLFWILYR